MTQTIIIKVGTKVLTTADGQLDLGTITSLTDQIASLKRAGHRVVLVSSGAVGAGRLALKLPSNRPETAARQMYAAVGQARLISLYSEALAPHGIICAQVLATKEDFRDQAHYFNMRSCFENLLHDDVLPIVNENDVVAVSELLFTDNDELAGLVASMLNADALLILSSIEGLLDADGEVMASVNSENMSDAAAVVTPVKSAGGRGGMVTKFAIAKRLTAQGIKVCIGNGKRPEIVGALLSGSTGTSFEPTAKKPSAGKRRLAHSDGLSRGAAYLDARAQAAILGPDAVSLLPVGVIRVEGDFTQGDIIEILDASGQRLGFGRAEIDSATVAQKLGLKNAGVLVHYNHMFIE